MTIIPATPTRRARRGFTLLELLVAVVLLSVGILALAKSMTSLGGTSTRTRMRADLAEVVDGKLEDLRQIGTVKAADSMQLTFGGSTTSCVANHCDTVTDARGIQHVRRWAVAAGPVDNWTRAVTVQAVPLSAAFPGLMAERTSLIVLMR